MMKAMTGFFPCTAHAGFHDSVDRWARSMLRSFLPKLHLTRGQLIDSEAACYAETRAWAQASFDQRPSAQGIVWGSRRDDSARCLMLFQQRFRGSPIREVLHETPLASPPQREQFVDLALRLGIHLI